MHVDAIDPSVTMMMDLISSANNFCIVFGFCDYLGKITRSILKVDEIGPQGTSNPQKKQNWTIKEINIFEQ